MVAQKNGPLTILRDRRRRLQNVDDREAIFRVDGHKQSWHQGEVKVHMAFIPLAEVGGGIFGPLVGFGQKQAILELALDMTAQFFEKGVGFGQILTVGAFSFIEVGYSVEPQSI